MKDVLSVSKTTPKATSPKASAKPKRPRKPVLNSTQPPTSTQTPVGELTTKNASGTQDNEPTRRRGPASAANPKRRIDSAETLSGPKGPVRTSAAELATKVENGETLDDTQLNGLSKKERRRLRKLKRDASRKAASAR